GQTRGQSSATNTGDTGPASSTAAFRPVAHSGDSGPTGSTGGIANVVDDPAGTVVPLLAARATAAPTPPALGAPTTGRGGRGAALGHHRSPGRPPGRRGRAQPRPRLSAARPGDSPIKVKCPTKNFGNFPTPLQHGPALHHLGALDGANT